MTMMMFSRYIILANQPGWRGGMNPLNKQGSHLTAWIRTVFIARHSHDSLLSLIPWLMNSVIM